MTIQEATHILDTQEFNIPWEAIEFLYDHPYSKEVEEKIIYAFEHAEEDAFIYRDSEKQITLHTPIWYAIVAEQYVTEPILNAVFQYFSRNADPDEILDEQIHFLTGELSKNFPDTYVGKLLDLLELQALITIEFESIFIPKTAFLFEGLANCYHEKYKTRLLNIMANPNTPAVEVLYGDVAMCQIKEALPILEEVVASGSDEKYSNYSQTIIEAQEAIDILNGTIDTSDWKSYSESRADWKTVYRQFEVMFEPLSPSSFEEELALSDLPSTEVRESFSSQLPILKKNKTGRNEPCPCGSGKKYKKCCLP